MDNPRSNSPSRKSRFRAQGSSPYRPAGASEAPEELPVDAAEESQVEPSTADTEVLETPPMPEAVAHGQPPPMPDDSPKVALESEDQLPAGLRLTRSTERSSERPRRSMFWPVTLTAVCCLVAGGAGGYILRARNGGAASTTTNVDAGHPSGPTVPLNPPVIAEVDAAFEASKQGQYGNARQDFTRLAEGRHGGWPSMQIEAARAALYEHDFDGAERTLSGLLRAGPNVDAEFLMGLLQMTLQAYDKSEAAFGRAVALDPARPDVFYFWGECLRRQGKPQDAAEKFHQALIRNQYETTEGLYQLKLWLSEIQADQEAAKGSNAKIDADLASGHPSGPALFAAAARHLKAGQYKEAGERVAQAQKVVEPAVFRVVLQDPIFLQENYRAELAPFYK